MLEQFAPFFEMIGLEPIWNNLPRFFWGVVLTLEITILSVALGLALAGAARFGARVQASLDQLAGAGLYLLFPWHAVVGATFPDLLRR